ARLRDTLRVNATMGVEQNSPMLTPGVQNEAFSDATARSHVATSWQPAADAVPCTAAITGFGQCRIACITVEHSRMRLSVKARPPSASVRWAVSSFRLWPAENT